MVYYILIKILKDEKIRVYKRMIDLKVRDILNKTLKGIPLSMDDLIYLQKHKEEVQETHDLNLIELSLNKSEHEPCYKFLKVI